MIFRCTAQFMCAFDALAPQHQQLVKTALLNFKHSPRLPTADVWPVMSSNGIWALPIANIAHITYHFESGIGNDNVCVFRHVATIPSQDMT